MMEEKRSESPQEPRVAHAAAGSITPNRVRIKCHYNNEIRTVSLLSTDCNFAKLKRRLTQDYGFEVTLKYEDRDGDMITLASQNDFNDLLIGEPETVNVMVSESTLPDLAKRAASSSNTGLFSHPSPFSAASHQRPLPSPTMRKGGPLTRSDSGDGGRGMDRFPQIDNVGGGSVDVQIRWKQGEILGQGAFGVVYLGLNIDTGELMAVKQMAIDEVSSRTLSTLENEIYFLRSLRHQNIVRYVGTEITPAALSIFLEYVPGGSLKALIDKFGQLEESVAKSYTRQLLLGLEYLHRNGIAHRDIKGANCLVGNDGVIKLADFGNSKPWRSDANAMAAPTEGGAQQSGDIKGTPSWMAPEVIRDQGNQINWKKADVWSLACTTLEMTTGKPPWAQFNNPVTVLYHIACQETLPEYPNPASVELVTFLNICLQRDPAQRPDITSLLLHPFVATVGGSGWNNAAVSGINLRPSTVSTAPRSDWVESGGMSSGSRRGGSAMPTPVAFGSLGSPELMSPTRVPRRMPGTYTNPSSRDTSPKTVVYGQTPGHPYASPAGRGPMRCSNLMGVVPPSPGGSILIESRASTPSLHHQGLFPIDVTTHPETAHEIDVNNVRSTGMMTEQDSLEGSIVTGHVRALGQRLSGGSTGGGLLDGMDGEGEGEGDGDAESIVSEMTTSVASAQGTSVGVYGGTAEAPSASVSIEGPNLAVSRGLSLEPLDISPPLEEKRQWQDAAILHGLAADEKDKDGFKGYEKELEQVGLLRPSPTKAQRDPLLKAGGKGLSGKNASRSSSVSRANKSAKDDDAAGGGQVSGKQRPTLNKVVTKNRQGTSGKSKDSKEAMNEKDSRSGRRVSPVKQPSRYVRKEDAKYPSRSASRNEDSISGMSEAEPKHRDDGNRNAGSMIANSDSSVSSASLVREPKGSNPTPFQFSSPPEEHLCRPSDEIEVKRLAVEAKLDIDMKSHGESSQETERVLIHAESLDSQEMVGDMYVHFEQRIDDLAEVATDEEDFYRVHSDDALVESHVEDEIPNAEDIAYNESQVDLKRYLDTPTSEISRKTRASSDTTERGNVRLMPVVKTKKLSRISISSENLQIPDPSSALEVQPFSAEPLQYRRSPSLEWSNPPSNPFNDQGLMIISSSQGTPSLSQGELFESPQARKMSYGVTKMPAPQPSPNGRSVMQSRNRTMASRQQTAPLTSLNESTDSMDMDRELQLRQVSVQGKSVTPKTKQTMDFKDFDDHDSLYGSHDGYDDKFGSGIDIMSATMLSEHTAAVSKLRAPGRANLLLSSSADGTIKLWGLGADETQSRLTLDVNAYASSAKVEAPSESNSKRISQRGRASSEPPPNAAPTPKPLVRINGCWADDSCSSIWGACSDGGLMVWAGVDGRPIRHIQAHDETITAMEGGEIRGVQALTYMCTGSADRTIRVWDARAKRPQVLMLRGHSDSITAIRWGEGGKTIVSASRDKTLRIWDMRSGRCSSVLEKHFGAVSCLRTIPEDVSESGGSLGSYVSGGRDAMINMWSAGGQSLATTAAHRGPVVFLSEVNSRYVGRSGAMSPAIVSIGNDNLLKTWDLKRMKVANEIQVASDPSAGSISRAVWAEQAIITCSSTGFVKVFESPFSAARNISSAQSVSQGASGYAQGEMDGFDLAQLGEPCTDLISAPTFVATGTKSGQIVKWVRR